MGKRVYELPSDKLTDNMKLITSANEAEIQIVGILQPGIALEREAWLDNFYRIRVNYGKKSGPEIIIPGKVLKNIKDCEGKTVEITGKLLSKSDGKDVLCYIMAKSATATKKTELGDTINAEGFALSAPDTKRDWAYFNLMIPHYSGIHNVLRCACEKILIKEKKIEYGSALKVSGRLENGVYGYQILATNVSRQ